MRWIAVSLAAGSSIEIAGLTPSARCVWLACRFAHGMKGLGGVLPAREASAIGLQLAAPAFVAGIDIDAALDELVKVGLIRLQKGRQRGGAREGRRSSPTQVDGLVLVDWDAETEQALCSSCRSRNPDPRHRRCPACRERDTDPTRRASRKRGADVAQTSRAEQNGRASQRPHGFADGSEVMAQTNRSARTGAARPRPDPTQPDRPNPYHQPRAYTREAPASPAGESIRAMAAKWAVGMAARGVESMTEANAVDVESLLAELSPPRFVHDRAAMASSRRELARRVVCWCPSPERLARWIVVASRRGVANVGAYLRRAVAGGDPGTMLARHGQGEGVLGRVAEIALRGERVGAVAELVESLAALHDARLTDAQRHHLRAELARYVRHGRRDAARTVLLQLVGTDRSDVVLARAIGEACTLAEARQLLGAA